MSTLRCPICGVDGVYPRDEFCPNYCTLPPRFGVPPDTKPKPEPEEADGYMDPFASALFNPADPAPVVEARVPDPPAVVNPAPVALASHPAPPPIPQPAAPVAAAPAACFNCDALTEATAEICPNCKTRVRVICADCRKPTWVRKRLCKHGGEGCRPVADSLKIALAEPTVGVPPPVSPSPPVAWSPPTTWSVTASPPPSPPLAPPLPKQMYLVILDQRGNEAQRFPLRSGPNEVGAESPGDHISPDIDLSGLDPDCYISRRQVLFLVDSNRVSMTVRTDKGTTQMNGELLSQNAMVEVPHGALIRFAHLTAKILPG